MSTTTHTTPATIHHIDTIDEHLRVWIDFSTNEVLAPRGMKYNPNECTMREYRGYAADYRLTCCSGITADEWEALLEEIRPLVQQIHDLGEEVWDGNGMVFRVGEEGHGLKVALETLINEYQPPTTIEVWEASEWLGATVRFFGADGDTAHGDHVRVEFDGTETAITPHTTDDEIEALADEFEAMAASTHIVLGLANYLEQLRDECQSNADATEGDTMSYTIASVKFSERFEGTKAAAIQRAKMLDEEYQPAFDTTVEDEYGDIVWSSASEK